MILMPRQHCVKHVTPLWHLNLKRLSGDNLTGSIPAIDSPIPIFLISFHLNFGKAGKNFGMIKGLG
jgi:hypothetical protein